MRLERQSRTDYMLFHTILFNIISRFGQSERCYAMPAATTIFHLCYRDRGQHEFRGYALVAFIAYLHYLHSIRISRSD